MIEIGKNRADKYNMYEYYFHVNFVKKYTITVLSRVSERERGVCGELVGGMKCTGDGA